MSDMSFKQAKELSERLELSEITLKQILDQIDSASKNFENSLEKQEKILHFIPNNDKKLNLMKILLGVNVGFIFGLIAAQYIF